MFRTLMRPALVLFLVLWLKLVKYFLKLRCMLALLPLLVVFFFQAEDGIRDTSVTGVQTCALPISPPTRRDRTGVARRRWSAPRGRPGRTPAAARRSGCAGTGNALGRETAAATPCTAAAPRRTGPGFAARPRGPPGTLRRARRPRARDHGPPPVARRRWSASRRRPGRTPAAARRSGCAGSGNALGRETAAATPCTAASPRRTGPGFAAPPRGPPGTLRRARRSRARDNGPPPAARPRSCGPGLGPSLEQGLPVKRSLRRGPARGEPDRQVGHVPHRPIEVLAGQRIDVEVGRGVHEVDGVGNPAAHRPLDRIHVVSQGPHQGEGVLHDAVAERGIEVAGVHVVLPRRGVIMDRQDVLLPDAEATHKLLPLDDLLDDHGPEPRVLVVVKEVLGRPADEDVLPAAAVRVLEYAGKPDVP